MLAVGGKLISHPIEMVHVDRHCIEPVIYVMMMPLASRLFLMWSTIFDCLHLWNPFSDHKFFFLTGSDAKQRMSAIFDTNEERVGALQRAEPPCEYSYWFVIDYQRRYIHFRRLSVAIKLHGVWCRCTCSGDSECLGRCVIYRIWRVIV